MAQVYNIYCDESCHLKNDEQPVMAIGAVWCPLQETKSISESLRATKQKHGLARNFEIKWTKVSPAKIGFYIDIIEYFFNNEDLHFRSVIIPNKKRLNHKIFNQSHDEWYYKMFFILLKEIIDPSNSYRIYIDIKDTNSEQKKAKLEQVLRNSNYDSTGHIVEKVQQIRSHESEILQLTDLILGALRYKNQGLNTGVGKLEIINLIKSLSRKSLQKTTWPREPKLNILMWQGQGDNS